MPAHLGYLLDLSIADMRAVQRVIGYCIRRPDSGLDHQVADRFDDAVRTARKLVTHEAHRSAVDGQFVSDEEASSNPATTVRETRVRPA